MKRFILIPDSFKGTMSSMEICGIMAEAIKAHIPDAGVRGIPVADGGEGTVEAFISAVGGEKRETAVTGPRFEKISSFYGALSDGKTAVVEMSAAAGLPLMGSSLDVLGSTTFGVGELILEAVRGGAGQVIIGLGGSATSLRSYGRHSLFDRLGGDGRHRAGAERCQDHGDVRHRQSALRREGRGLRFRSAKRSLA